MGLRLAVTRLGRGGVLVFRLWGIWHGWKKERKLIDVHAIESIDLMDIGLNVILLAKNQRFTCYMMRMDWSGSVILFFFISLDLLNVTSRKIQPTWKNLNQQKAKKFHSQLRLSEGTHSHSDWLRSLTKTILAPVLFYSPPE